MPRAADNDYFDRKRLLSTAILLLAYGISGAVHASLVPDPKERVEYWRSNYTELSEASDRRVAQAQMIFERILNAAGSRHGVHPRLLIIKEDPLRLVLQEAPPCGGQAGICAGA
ncbi:MAG: hypothetical protein AMJ53_11570 [Gammaproteobacteria bacterium SG8_11]|nr:MAG: hypothetical protein AMJ53_11570 [Gammaproteobacteria bacterium SG8_11]